MHTFINYRLEATNFVILSLLVESRYFIFVHERNPASVIPHVPFATNRRSDFENGAHVVISGLRVASRYSIVAHKRNPASVIPHGRNISLHLATN